MKNLAVRQVWLVYLSAIVVALVFLPGLIDFDKGLLHVGEHFLLFIAAGIFTFSLERLRQMAVVADANGQTEVD
ncbi:hypothetical protein [Alicyclobacillus dauci]|uniref:Uncharacterized protein n=1 Tax=Alicyclobacillus dauci TaxID=1475485 RepID=A0ABY6Z4X5_9BACL|nr:hypothetical protein [Alicyclobacillus dauci]WAH37932.1 hypothetical protein NZD86_05420 [Alicyclobacillus dauci]